MMTTRLAIVILQRGWVYVGRRSVDPDGSIVVEGARCVRRWSTAIGLGPLATTGPDDATVLDAPCQVRYHPLAELYAIDCDEEAWADA